MILECPSCHARYLVQIGLFAQGGRTVRCARCKNQWHFSLPTSIDVVAPRPSPAEIFAAMREEAPQPAVSPEADPFADIRAAVRAKEPPELAPGANLPVVPRRRFKITWADIEKLNLKKRFVDAVKVVLVMAFILAWPVMAHDSIVRAVPSLRGVYELFGFHIKHTGEGLGFRDVRSELRYDSGLTRLYVDGSIINTTNEIQLIPDIMAQALGADHAVIQSWWVEPPKPTIPAGGEIPFHTEINATSQQTIVDLYLEFKERQEETKKHDGH
jgi:predicted Zn finger-like uncharacterized protein